MKPRPVIHPRTAKPDTPSGFTLIELILVIAVMMLATLALIPLASIRTDERALRETADALEKFARTGRAAALYDRAYSVLEIGEGGFTLRIEEQPDPEAAAAEDVFFTERAGEAPPGTESYTHEIPEGAEIRVKAWTESRWQKPDGFLWEFQRSGLCEPLQFRVAMGESWIELGFSPLTAEVREESYAFP